MLNRLRLPVAQLSNTSRLLPVDRLCLRSEKTRAPAPLGASPPSLSGIMWRSPPEHTSCVPFASARLCPCRSRREFRLPAIASKYLKGWLIIDAASLLPSLVDILPHMKGSGLDKDEGEGQDQDVTNLLRILRALRLLKLVRIVRIGRLLARWRTRVSVSFSTITAVQLLMTMFFGTHWVACLLTLQTTFADRKMDTWLGAFGWCQEIGVGEEECASNSEIYVACLHWAFGIVSGAIPYPAYRRTEEYPLGNFTHGELAFNLTLVVFGALVWTYFTAQILDIVFNANPDHTAFKTRMDNLNRFISFNDLDPEVASRLREYFWETRLKVAAESRQEICAQMSTGLQEMTCGLIHGEWLRNVPFFCGFVCPDGDVMAAPVSELFIAQVATHLKSEVYVPLERPPLGRLYVIYKGSARYRGRVRGGGYSWGALDVMLPNAPLQKRAIATTYLHVLWIDGKKLRRIAKDFPADARSMRTWTLWKGLKEYLLDNLRKASEEERRAAKQWVQEQQPQQKRSFRDLWQGSTRKIIFANRWGAADVSKPATRRARTLPELECAVEKTVQQMGSHVEKIILGVAHSGVAQARGVHAASAGGTVVTVASLQQAMDRRFEALEDTLNRALLAAAGESQRESSSQSMRQKRRPSQQQQRMSLGASAPQAGGTAVAPLRRRHSFDNRSCTASAPYGAASSVLSLAGAGPMEC